MHEEVAVVRLILGTLLLVVVPGWAWSRVLVPEMRGLERFVLAVVLSVGSLVLFLYLGNILFGLPVKPGSAVLASLVITAAGLAFPLARRLRARLDRPAS